MGVPGYGWNPKSLMASTGLNLDKIRYTIPRATLCRYGLVCKFPGVMIVAPRPPTPVHLPYWRPPDDAQSLHVRFGSGMWFLLTP